MQINSRKENWVEGIEKWDLISYSVLQNIASLIAKDSITVGGFFHHVSHAIRRSVLRDMLDGIPGITMTWTAMHLGRACSLASNGEYQAFLAEITRKRKLPILASVLPLTSVPLVSLLNAIGTTALQGVRTLAYPAAKTTASRARAIPALPAQPAKIIEMAPLGGHRRLTAANVTAQSRRDTLQITASKEMRISKKMERNKRGRTTTMRMGMKDMTYSRNYRANERKFQHGPILRGKCLVFVDKKFVGKYYC
jgi:hypothetical protein